MFLCTSDFHPRQISAMDKNPHSYMIVFAFHSPSKKKKKKFKTEDTGKVRATQKCSPSFFQSHNKY